MWLWWWLIVFSSGVWRCRKRYRNVEIMHSIGGLSIRARATDVRRGKAVGGRSTSSRGNSYISAGEKTEARPVCTRRASCEMHEEQCARRLWNGLLIQEVRRGKEVRDQLYTLSDRSRVRKESHRTKMDDGRTHCAGIPTGGCNFDAESAISGWRWSAQACKSQRSATRPRRHKGAQDVRQ